MIQIKMEISVDTKSHLIIIMSLQLINCFDMEIPSDFGLNISIDL